MNLTFLKELNRSELIETLEPGDIVKIKIYQVVLA